MNIKQFLFDPNRKFKDGLALYNTVKTSKEYDDFFNKSGDAAPGTLAFNILEKQLQRALRKQQNSEPEPSKKQTETSNQEQATTNKPAITVKKLEQSKKQAPPAIGSDESTDPGKRKFVDIPNLKNVDDLPENIKNAYFENKRLITELAGARQRMAACKTNEDRKPIAQEIAAINRQKEQNWKDINDFVNGKTADESDKTAVTLDPAKEALKLNRRISTVKINISRAQKEIDSGKLKGKKLETRLASLQSWEKELVEMEGKLPR
ncbi:MAG: hypothetical protein IH597_14980 [Bacteroidales bacterium]|nr:hypothetical protein [Bacteroidales bacterium]